MHSWAQQLMAALACWRAGHQMTGTTSLSVCTDCEASGRPGPALPLRPASKAAEVEEESQGVLSG